MNRRPLALVALGLCAAVALAGCATTYGSRTVEPTRFDYNEALAQSWNQQMLLNLVRLRYRDTPQFLEVSSVLAQYSFTGAGGASASFMPGRDSHGLVAELEYAERPTISYTPLQGKDFAERLLTPIAPATLVLLSQSGWSIERLMLCCVQQVNDLLNSPSAAGPTPDRAPRYQAFHRLSQALRELQNESALRVALREKDDGGGGGDGDAEDDGSGGGEPAVVLRFQVEGAEQQATLDEVVETLGLAAGRRDFRLTTERMDRDADEIAVVGRSLSAVLFFLSQSVEVPTADETAGLVTVTRDADGERFDWAHVTGPLLRVRSTDAEPEAAFVQVRYRGHWFYIDDRDLNSKTTFGLLSFLFSLQSAPPGRSPLLTVSTGG
jgi:hypothetical protein